MPFLGSRLVHRIIQTYLMRADFSQAQDPATIYTEGIGALNLVENDGTFTIANGKLNYPAQSSPNWADLGFYAEKVGGGSFARVRGRTLQVGFNTTGAAVPFIYSWHSATGLGGAADLNTVGEVLFEDGAFRPFDGGLVAPIPFTSWSGLTDESFSIMLLSTGFLVFKRTNGKVRLHWVGVTSSASNLYPVFKNYVGVGGMDYIKVRDFTLASDTVLATMYQATPVSGTLYQGSADGTFDLVMVSPSSLANQTELRFRVVDDSNYWVAYLKADGSLIISKFVAGVETVVRTVTSVVTTSQTIRVRIMAVADKISAMTYTGTAWTMRGTQITDAFQQTATGVKAVIGATWSASGLASWSYESGNYNGYV